MSRSGYSDDCDGWDLIRWRGAVASAIRGKRGQQFLKEMLAALDAMPEKRLIANELQDERGGVCAIGAVGAARGIDMKALDPDEPEGIAKTFDVASALVQDIADMNDDAFRYAKPSDIRSPEERRWQSMRDWCAAQIIPPLAMKER